MAIQMSISAHFQPVRSRREGRRTKPRVGRSLQRGKYKSPRLAERSWRRPATSATGTQWGTAVPSRAGNYTPSRTAWSLVIAFSLASLRSCGWVSWRLKVPSDWMEHLTRNATVLPVTGTFMHVPLALCIRYDTIRYIYVRSKADEMARSA